MQELRHAVDLVVVPSVGKAEQLALERRQPVGFLGNQGHAALDLGGLDREPRLLVVARRAQFEPPELFVPKLLAERIAGGGLPTADWRG
jgi:hypothetical protein